MKISREDYRKIVSAGIKTGTLDFVNDLCKKWLSEFPGDINSELYLARIAHLRDDENLSARLLSNVLLRDPENIEAYEELVKNRELRDQKAVNSFIHVLSGRTDDLSIIFPWAVTLRAIRIGIRKGELVNSERLLRNLLVQEPNNPLVALEHCRLSSIKDENSLFSDLSDTYRNLWPDCIQFRLLKALSLIRNHNEISALEMLHQCIAKDPEGLVVTRLMGHNHDFVSLWQTNQQITIDNQIPTSIAISLDWNRLTEGGKTSENDTYFGQINDKSNDKSSSGKNSREIINNLKKSVYVILSTNNGLYEKFGEKSAEFIIEQLKKLSIAINKRAGWEAVVFLPDEIDSTQRFGLSPINKNDAWKIKLSLHDLETQLRKQSKHIGAVLIVGGNEVVPFHQLPNPTDDSDNSVPSDNPYGTTSGNFLIQEWSVGRLPDEKGSDAGLLLEQIRQIHQFHSTIKDSDKKFKQIFNSLKRKIDLRRFFFELFNAPKDFGYSAAVWRRSTLAAFRPLGKGADLRVTPPYDKDTIDIENLMKAKCAYFNLHGLSDTPDWYGQRDFSEEPSGPDFPVAISAKQISKTRNNVDLVFTEACYGGFVNKKTIDDSMALKLISIGSQGLVASTCIAYGSVFTPLIGADLLGFIFWKYTKDGYSFGESLLQAKLGLIKVMSQRQGYLDGEDQKTLLSFVLYGDPLGYLEPHIYLDKSHNDYKQQIGEFKTISDQDGIISKESRVSQSKVKEISELVQGYMPSLDNADIKIRQHQIRINKIVSSKDASNAKNSPNEFLNKFTQLQYSQKTKGIREVHEQFIRVTLDNDEKIIKLAISR